MRYFVTGATGFVGGRVVRQLRAAGHDVVTVARTPAKAQGLRDLGVEIHQGDVTNKDSMRDHMRGVDGVYHIAGWYKIGTADKDAGYATNVEGTRNVLELMRDLAIPKGVYTSTIAVFSDTGGRLVNETYRYDGPHLSVYDQTKWLAHYEVAEPLIAQGLPLVILQPGVIYGPGDTSSMRTTFIQYLQRTLPLVPKQTTFCWSHVDDIATAHLQGMAHGTAGESYIVAGPAHTLIDALTLAESITGVAAPRLRVAPAVVKGLAAAMSVVEKAVAVPEDYTSEYLCVSAGTTYIADNSKARKAWGYAPRSLATGLRETLVYEMRLLGMRPPSDDTA